MILVAVMNETFTNLKKVFQYGKQYKWIFCLEIFCTIIQALIGILLPLLLAKQIVLFTDNAFYQLVFISLGIMVISLFNIFNFAIIAKTCAIFRRGTIKSIQTALGKEMLKITQADMEKYGTGTFIERLNQDANSMTQIFTRGIGYLSGFITNIGIFISIFVINKIVFLYYFAVALVLTLLHLLKTKKIGEQEIKLRKKKDSCASLIGELVRGAKDIKMLSAKESFMNKLSSMIVTRNDMFHSLRNLEIVFNTLINSLTQVFSFLLVLFFIVLIKKEIITVAIAIALFTYKTNVMTNFMEKVSLLLETAKDFNISSNRVFEILENGTFAKEKFGSTHLDIVKGDFSFSHVHFSYDDYQVLCDLSFQIHRGETVAFVGKSGAGKSTIFNLIGRLYTPTKGEILVDNTALQLLDEYSIRNHITLISQSPYIFNMSIRDNFLLVKENVTEEEIIEALKKASLYKFVCSLPGGLDTIIGEGGTNLSGGQRQRLAIARAFVQKTKIILFDEATSALDNETQKDIQSVIENLKGEYTLLIIAHRLSTIKNADRILVLDKGKIIAEGTHTSLLKDNSTYKKLYESELLDKKEEF